MDGDGLDDAFEIEIGSDLLLQDTDGDGLKDFQEVALIGDGLVLTIGADTDPANPDTDVDGLDNATEVHNGANPLDPSSSLLLADADMAPWDAPDYQVNEADELIAIRLVLGQRTAGSLQYAHGDMNTDGVIDLADLLPIQQAVF